MPRHGTRSCYRRGCRAPECVEANRAYFREMQAQRREAAAPAGWSETEPRVELSDTTWIEMANCRGMAVDLFFPTTGEQTAEAKAVCAGCAVRQECLDYALRGGERFGIWGGTSELERRRLRRRVAARVRQRGGTTDDALVVADLRSSRGAVLSSHRESS